MRASEQPGGAVCQRSERVEGAGSRAAERHVPAGPPNNRPNAQNSRACTAGLPLAYLSTGSPSCAGCLRGGDGLARECRTVGGELVRFLNSEHTLIHNFHEINYTDSMKRSFMYIHCCFPISFIF